MPVNLLPANGSATAKRLSPHPAAFRPLLGPHLAATLAAACGTVRGCAAPSRCQIRWNRHELLGVLNPAPSALPCSKDLCSQDNCFYHMQMFTCSAKMRGGRRNIKGNKKGITRSKENKTTKKRINTEKSEKKLPDSAISQPR